MSISISEAPHIQPGAIVVFRGNAYTVVFVSNGNAIGRMHEAHGNNVLSIPFTDPDLFLLYPVEEVPVGFSTNDYIHGDRRFPSFAEREAEKAEQQAAEKAEQAKKQPRRTRVRRAMQAGK